ncbi:tripartite tricarboxylate transporter TctB family protein [Kribbella albertanoniae]|uniref:Tripartite tricarboxylate transporter TctB family protein n=1 Tax=Kribbella albertanoniae TaxID=1266829 RepID=A0A4R4NYE8_9ACTN|nr:tripartite tricarboxylate transporter TctB family protein [Kribbella albertanoniae]TDC14595.1 tripartite tricarboxylate transporter TctB family protein [Kribbella albertanoniae]
MSASEEAATPGVRAADVEVEASRLVRIIAAIVLIVLSATFLVGVFDIRSPKGFDPAGPRFFPLLVTTAWLLFSIGYLIEGLRSPKTAKAEGDRAWFEPVTLSALLVLYALLVVPLGYLIATALLFFAAARVLGSRQLIRDIVVALVLAIIVYVAFTRFLDISLPEGVLGL